MTYAYANKFFVLNGLFAIPELLCALVYSRFNTRSTVANRGMLPVACLFNMVVSTMLIFLCVLIGFKKHLFHAEQRAFLALTTACFGLFLFWLLTFSVFDEYAQIYQCQADQIGRARRQQLELLKEKQRIKLSDREVEIKNQRLNHNLVHRIKQKES